jgi:hypothetical protein
MEELAATTPKTSNCPGPLNRLADMAFENILQNLLMVPPIMVV